MIWLLGDIHGRLDHITKAIDATPEKPAAVILLGDIEAPKPLGQCMKPVEAQGVAGYWIIGNHDTDHPESFVNISDPVSMARNLDGRVVAIDGLRVTADFASS